MFKNKKNIVIFLSLVFVGGCFLFLNSLFLKEKIVSNDNEWKTYIDDRYHYSVDFPEFLNISTTSKERFNLPEGSDEEFFVIDSGVNFSDPLSGFGMINISIFENTKFKNTDEWLEFENKSIDNHRMVIENTTKIDGIDAIITYPQSFVNGEVMEEFRKEKTAVFIKDGILFEIYIRLNDYDRFLDSFRFID